MAKNYAAIYNSPNDASALNQTWYLKEEAVPGQLNPPLATDFFWTLGGGGLAFNQPQEVSQHRSGRHNTDVIYKKKELSWTISTYFNIDETIPAGTDEIDPAMRTLWKSLLGYETVAGGSPVYNASVDPSITFSLFECGDKWSRQGRACFVQGGTVNLPGNGEATMEWTGNGAEAYLVGIGKSTTNNTGGNTVTLQTGEGWKFREGCLVMLIEANGTTRSADTASNTARRVTAIAGDVLTLSGAALADADGSGVGAPLYVVYYEPATATAINNPVTGLQGSFTIQGTTSDCFRQATIAIQNNHELVDYCYGKDTLDSPFFVAASKLDVNVSLDMNLNDQIIALINRVTEFEAQDINIVLGSATGRRMEIDMPKVRFPTPPYTVPDTGSIPVSLADGKANQTTFDAGDEITVSFL